MTVTKKKIPSIISLCEQVFLVLITKKQKQNKTDTKICLILVVIFIYELIF